VAPLMRLSAGALVQCFGMLGFSLLVLVAYLGFADNVSRPERIGVGGPFRLIDQNGRTVTERDFLGKWQLIYFGYTHCPAACPMALNNIALAVGDLKRGSAQVVPIFITIDPDRDTPAVMKDYAASFQANLVGLSGSALETARVEQEFQVSVLRHPTPDGGYDFDHSTGVFLLDPKGEFAGFFSSDVDPDAMAARISKIMARSAT
jgi:protein SCO1